MDDLEAKIRVRAYEIWERQGRSGDPEDHWLQAEREVKSESEQAEASQDRSEATTEDAPPAEAVEAATSVGNGSANRRSASSAAKKTTERTPRPAH